MATPAVSAETRPTPRAGDDVLIVHLAAAVPGVVLAVYDDGRRVEVLEGEQETTREFVLSRQTARFVSGPCGPRLRWRGV